MSRRFGLRRHYLRNGIYRSGVTPLVSFGDGTFTRSTEASMPLLFSPGDTVTWLPADTPRYAGTAPNGGRYIAIEGARTNVIGFSETISQLSGATQATDVGGDPDGESHADRLLVNTNGGYGRHVIGMTSGVRYIGSWFGKHVSGDANWLCRLFVANTPGNQDTAAALTSQWQRFVTPSAVADATSNGILYAIENGVGNDNEADLWGWQIETGAVFPSSYIRTAGASATRPRDALVFGSGVDMNVPHTICVRPSFSSADVISGSTIHAIYSPVDSTNRLDFALAGGNCVLRLIQGNVVKTSRILTFSRGQELTITVDASTATLTIAGATTGDGSTAGTPFVWPTGRLDIGANSAGSTMFFGLISEPVAA